MQVMFMVNDAIMRYIVFCQYLTLIFCSLCQMKTPAGTFLVSLELNDMLSPK